MNWDALGAIGEIVSAFAVIITLFYLAFQIRQNNVQTKSEALRIAIQAWVDQQRRAFETEEDVAFMRKALNDYVSLSKDEKGRFFGILLGYIPPFSNIRENHMAGLMDEEAFRAIEVAFASVVSSPGARDCIESFQRHTALPFWIMEYVRGNEPTRTKVQPMSETFDFVKLGKE